MKRRIIAIGITLAVLIVFGGITVSAQQTARVKNVNKHIKGSVKPSKNKKK